MKFTPFQVAMGLSLLLHGGAATAVYVLKAPAATKAKMQLAHGQVLTIEVLSEPAPEIATLPVPVTPPTVIPTPTSTDRKSTRLNSSH